MTYSIILTPRYLYSNLLFFIFLIKFHNHPQNIHNSLFKKVQFILNKLQE